MARIKLEGIDFLTTKVDHTFNFRVDPGNGMTFPLPVVVAALPDDGLDALARRARENLVTVLEQALEQAKHWEAEDRATTPDSDLTDTPQSE